MVLSNKKLKNKLRSLAAESIVESELRKSGEDGEGEGEGGLGKELQRLKAVMASKSRKNNLPKRVKKRNIPPVCDESKKNSDSGIVDSLVGKGQVKKRKREGDGSGLHDGDGEEKKKKKKKKKKSNKKLKNKTKRKKKGDEKKENGEEKLTEPSAVEVSTENAKKVYVGGIPYYSNEDDIRSFFESCGSVSEVDCMKFPESGKFRGIAILTFKTAAAAKRALALDGSDMGGFFLKIQPFKISSRAQKEDFSPEIVEGYNRIYVGNLSWEITEDDLRNLLCDCRISAIRWGTDKETEEFKGYAHVDFNDSASLSVALKLDQQVVHGRPVRIRCAVAKKAGETTSNSEQAKLGKNSKDSLKKIKESGKRVRRTCYKCGITGHVSSSCPRKEKEADRNVSGEKISNPCGPDYGKPKRKKRQTCYICGVPGHLSSACPQKEAVPIPSTVPVPAGATTTSC